MTRDDSLTIVGMILNSWPGRAWTEQEMDAYAHGIEDLDAAATTRALARASRELRYRPSIAELREYTRAEQRLAEPDRDYRHERHSYRPPEWACVWMWMRANGDERILPQQDFLRYYDEVPPPISELEYERVRLEWVEAGAPVLAPSAVDARIIDS